MKRPMTLSEAGRRGGEKVKRERGTDFYAEIGRKGGRRVAQSHGSSFYSEIGRKGGEARRPGAPEEEDI
ncbi:MAG TPA: KGG domain-containing protein [Candidatus Thermoplasmatota archaeon]|nr:KGG domain-containing protein [Candidatus Thermoplasmatota archaeon]